MVIMRGRNIRSVIWGGGGVGQEFSTISFLGYKVTNVGVYRAGILLGKSKPNGMLGCI